MARIHTVKKAKKEHKCRGCGGTIAKGDTYYWAKPRAKGMMIRCTKCGAPKASEMTSSAYTGGICALQEGMGQMFQDVDSIEGDIQSMKESLEEIMEQCQESLDNMPEQFQETSSSGEMLQERIDNLQGAIDELDSVETEFDDNAVEYEEGASEEAKKEKLEEEHQKFCDQAREAAEECLGNLWEGEMAERIVLIIFRDMSGHVMMGIATRVALN